MFFVAVCLFFVVTATGEALRRSRNQRGRAGHDADALGRPRRNGVRQEQRAGYPPGALEAIPVTRGGEVGTIYTVKYAR